jgi:NADPH:quinone reductase-like Zn-dependent oxidoreductase
MSATMRAIRQQAFGGPEVLELTEVKRPVPLPTEVLVRVRAAGVNPVEAVIRSGQFPLLGQPPFILGWDVSGVVEGIEPGVTRFQPGDAVYGLQLFPRPASAYAEYVAAPSRQLARKPARLSHAEAAALPLAGLTAWQALVDTARVAAGQRVLIHGAGGGVGHLAVQIVRARGAHVIGTASAAKHDLVASLGLEALAGLAGSGQLRMHLQAALSLAEAAKAHELLESGSVTARSRSRSDPGIDRALAAGPADAPARHPGTF